MILPHCPPAFISNPIQQHNGTTRNPVHGHGAHLARWNGFLLLFGLCSLSLSRDASQTWIMTVIKPKPLKNLALAYRQPTHTRRLTIGSEDIADGSIGSTRTRFYSSQRSIRREAHLGIIYFHRHLVPNGYTSIPAPRSCSCRHDFGILKRLPERNLDDPDDVGEEEKWEMWPSTRLACIRIQYSTLSIVRCPAQSEAH